MALRPLGHHFLSIQLDVGEFLITWRLFQRWKQKCRLKAVLPISDQLNNANKISNNVSHCLYCLLAKTVYSPGKWAWPTGVQLLVFFCSSVPVVLFDTPGISRCRSQHISVESSSLLHHSIYLWFICFTWWSIDELENLHADRTTVCFEPW